ncbi:MAG TPA: glycoside hydrolase family 15 protein, partial [Bradyrhizobium sp.]|uniref:glycoside hydrolase family 15 protein n=1 Tax=Bradyrhizobium sp. TaxID=376 RepID=UPI002BEAB139
MPLPIEDYGLIGDCETAALVGRDGSIDWLCWPAFDSDACFAALLGTNMNGRWLIAPAGEIRKTSRRYWDETLILETRFETADGIVALIDFMPPRGKASDVVRLVRGIEGRARMRMQLVIRFGFGNDIPWVRRSEERAALVAIAGQDMTVLRTPVQTRGEDMTTVADFEVSAGKTIPFVLTYGPSHLDLPDPIDPEIALKETETFWKEWCGRCSYEGEHRALVLRSLITLKALTFDPTGGIVAAPTTSLPEKLGGARNWDYRFCWLRDATFTLYALLISGYHEEALAWREWLLRAIAGSPDDLQIMYGIAGERRLTELELPWLRGYEASRPVRVGNAAHEQFQLDVYGEIMDSAYLVGRSGFHSPPESWRLRTALMEHLEQVWYQPDEGIWEVRGPRRHFTHSKVMAWVALDRAVKTIEARDHSGPLERWRKLRDHIHRDVCAHGFNSQRNAFVQYYGADALDAALLMIPLVGFLPPDDPRVAG